MFRSQEEYQLWANRRMHDNEIAQRAAEADNRRAAFVALIASGLDRSWRSSPDSFPANFDLQLTAEFTVNFILSQ